MRAVILTGLFVQDDLSDPFTQERISLHHGAECGAAGGMLRSWLMGSADGQFVAA